VFLARPRGWRNQVWETDHVQAPLLVDVDGHSRRPWITWFTDCATNAITGVAVTPGHPSRESVLAALRSAVLREEPYGPFGGLPEKVRVDRGKDFLSRTVTAAFDLLDVAAEDLPAYTPHLKGTVEGLNRAVESMFLAALPGYARQPRPGKRVFRPKDEVLLGFEDFTARLLAWISWWNTERRPAPLQGRTPLGAWQGDPTPLRDVPAVDLWTFTLEDAGTRTLTTCGVRFRKRDYVGAWMTGRAGIQVRVRRRHLVTAATYQYVDLPEACVVATRALLTARENITDTVAARAMMCLHGGAGFGKTLAVNVCLRELEHEDVRRITFRARPTARAVRYELFTALDLPGQPPRHPSEFDRLLPAPAGMVPWTRSPPAPVSSAPRARGDGPTTTSETTPPRTCSPRPRGWSR
jgi:hypothetical protein